MVNRRELDSYELADLLVNDVEFVIVVGFGDVLFQFRKLAENPAQVKRWIRAMTRSLLFVRDRPEDAADIALRRLRLRNITKPMLVEAIRSYTRAFPPGVPGVPSAEGVKSILENELRIPLKLDKPLAAENFFDLRWAEEVRKEFTVKGTNP